MWLASLWCNWLATTCNANIPCVPRWSSGCSTSGPAPFQGVWKSSGRCPKSFWRSTPSSENINDSKFLSTVWKLFKNLKIGLTYFSTVVPPSVDVKERKPACWEIICMPMFVAEFFVKAKKRKQVAWVKKICYKFFRNTLWNELQWPVLISFHLGESPGVDFSVISRLYSKWLYEFTCTWTVGYGTLSPTSLPAFIVLFVYFYFWMIGTLTWVRWNQIVLFISSSLMAHESDHWSMCFMAICMSSFAKCLSFIHLAGLFVLLLFHILSSL